jgi:hypothetical protein
MKTATGFFLLFFSALFPFCLLAQDNPVLTVEDYFTSTEITAMQNDNAAYFEEASNQLQRDLQATLSAVTSGNLTREQGDRNMAQRMEAFKTSVSENQTMNLQKLYSGGYQHLLIQEDPGLVDQDVSAEDDWIEDDTDDDMDIEMPSPAKKRFTASTVMGFGFHTLLNHPSTAPEVNFFRSGLFEIGFLGRIRFSKDNDKSPYFANVGLSYVFNSIRWKGNEYLLDRDVPTFTPSPQDLRRNDFENGYITLTAGLAYIQSKKRGLLFEVNAFAGYNVHSNNTIRFKTPENGRAIHTTYGKYGVNDFSYGLTAAIGLKNFAIYSRYDLSTLFRNSAGFEGQPFSIGVRFF